MKGDRKMVSYKAFYNGLNYFATITESTLVDGFDLCVSCKDWKGISRVEFQKEYKTVRAAEIALKKRFPAEWKKVE